MILSVSAIKRVAKGFLYECGGRYYYINNAPYKTKYSLLKRKVKNSDGTNFKKFNKLHIVRDC